MKHISTRLFIMLTVSLFFACSSDIQLNCDPETVKLQKAAGDNRLDLFPALVKAGADLNGSCKEHPNTPLTAAAWEGRPAAVKLLLAAGADPNELNYYGWTALMRAAQNGHDKVVQALLADQRLKVNLGQENDGLTALMIAAQNGHDKVVQALLADQRLEVNSKQWQGFTALMCATQNGHDKVVQALLADQRLEVNLKKNDGWTALIIAAQNGHLPVVQALLADQRLGVNLKQQHGFTALMLAAYEGHLKVVQALLADQRLEVNLKTNNGNTALMEAAENGHLKVVQALLADQRLEVNLKDNNSMTALMLAAVNGHLKIVQALLADQRLDVSLKNNNGDTALMIATRKNHPAVVSALKKGPSTTPRRSAKDITFNSLVLNASSSAPLPSNRELQEGIARLDIEMEKVQKLIAELKQQGGEMKEKARLELEKLNQELQRLEKEKASRKELKDLKEAFEGELLEVQGFMRERKKRLNQLSKEAQHKDFADRELAKVLSGEGPQSYAYHLMLGLNRLHQAAMMGTSGYFTGKNGKGYVSKAASATALLGKLLPVGSNYADIVAEAFNALDRILLKRAFANIIKLAHSPVEMDQIADGVMRELSLSNAGKLNPSLCNQQLRRIMNAAYHGKLKAIDFSGSKEKRIRKAVLVLSNIAEGVKDIECIRSRNHNKGSSVQSAAVSSPQSPYSRRRSRVDSFLNKSGNLRALKKLVAEQEDKDAPAGQALITQDLREAFKGKNRDALTTPGDLLAKEKGVRKPKGATKERIARRASGIFRVIDEVIFEDVQLKAMKKASLKLALKAALIDKILHAASFRKAFLSEDEATQHKVWGILKEEVEKIALKINSTPDGDIKVFAREVVSNLAEALDA